MPKTFLITGFEEFWVLFLYSELCLIYQMFHFVFHYFRSRSFVYNTEHTHYFNSDANHRSAAITNVFIMSILSLSVSTGLLHSTGCGICVTGLVTGGEQHLHYCCVCPIEGVKERG